ncbi:MAG TPA: TetR family transcriptional regulator [Streptosporangiaceae bacterium]
MARTKEFDPDEALDRALELFWARGYAATSMADLVAHLGIARASLYATFGGKRDLFLTVLDRYRQERDRAVIEALSAPGPALPAIRALVQRYTEESTDPQRRGCLIVNTAVELAARDPAAARAVEASWTTLETALQAALTRARAQDEIPAGADPQALARFLVVLFQGMRTMGRAPTDPARVRAAAHQALALLA